MALLQYLHERDCCEKGANAWLSSLTQSSVGLMIRPTGVHAGSWFVSLGITMGSACLGLPLKELKIKGSTFYTPDELADFSWVIVCDFTSVEAMTFKWTSPLSVRLQCGAWFKDHCLLVAPTCDAELLPRVAAKNAFWKIPKTGIIKLGGFVGARVDHGSFPELLLAVAAKVLEKDLSDEEKLQILRKRVPQSEDLLESIKNSEAADLLEEQDKAHLLEVTGSPTIHAATLNEFKTSVQILAASARKSHTGAAPREAAAVVGGPAVKKKRRYPPKVVVTSAMDASDVGSMLPDGCRMYVDKLDQSWRMQAYGGKWYGRSMRMYGYEGAAMLLIKEAWRIAIVQGFEAQCPFSEFGLS